MEQILERFEHELANPQEEGLAALSATLAEIRSDLERHFRREEKVFYSALQLQTAKADFDPSGLLSQHTDVQDAVAALESLLEEARRATSSALSLRAEISQVGWQIWNLVHHHMAEEEIGLFSFADEILDDETQERLAKAMEATD